MVCESLTSEVQAVASPWPIVLLLLNIFFPGLGTILNSCMGLKFNATTCIVGILQMLTAYILIGWVWAIWWGVIIMEKSSRK